MIDLDTRWKQRFQNFELALPLLREAVALSHQRPLSNLEQQGLFQAFEFTHELAWNVMKDFLAYQGSPDFIRRDEQRNPVRHSSNCLDAGLEGFGA